MIDKSFVFVGSGGQGVITASIILGEAAAIYEGLNAVQTQVYGPEARGGATRADVKISDHPICYPKITNPHVLVCLTQDAYNQFATIVRPGGLLIADPSLVTLSKKPEARQMLLPMIEAVKREIGKAVVLNICMLGCVVGMTGIVHHESIFKVLKDRMPQRFLEMNTKAFKLGLTLADEHDTQAVVAKAS